jgi:hypothetical protein
MGYGKCKMLKKSQHDRDTAKVLNFGYGLRSGQGIEKIRKLC